MGDDELRNRILQMSTAQLERMVKMEADQYRPDAIAIATEELVRRGCDPGPGDPQVPELHCLRCDSNMVYGGKKKFHEGTRLGVLGGLGELLVNRESFDLWACPDCGHVEFFTEV